MSERSALAYKETDIYFWLWVIGVCELIGVSLVLLVLNTTDWRFARAFLVLFCIAALLCCTAYDPSATHLYLEIPALVFCFFVIVRLSLLRVSDADPAAQPLALLTIHISRAPPLA